MSSGGSKTVVLVALAANLGIAIAKFAAAGLTRSSAMLSEAIHSLVDTSNQALLLYGLKRSSVPPTRTHPFGYSREIYFWSFVVAVLLFSMGAGVSVYEGISKLHNPHPISDFWVNYAVLGVALALEGVSAWKAITTFAPAVGPRGWFAALRASKDAALFAVRAGRPRGRDRAADRARRAAVRAVSRLGPRRRGRLHRNRTAARRGRGLHERRDQGAASSARPQTRGCWPASRRSCAARSAPTGR